MPSEVVINGILRFAADLEGVDLDVVREGLEIAVLHRKVESSVDKRLATWGLTCRQMEIIEALYFAPEGMSTPANLAEEVGLTRSAMTSALDSLEEPGYLVRGQHPSDRRMVSVSLSPAGRKFADERLPERYRDLADILGTLSAADRKKMLCVYTKLLELLEAGLEEEE